MGGRGGACCAQRCRQLTMRGGAGAMGRQQLGQATAHAMTCMGCCKQGRRGHLRPRPRLRWLNVNCNNMSDMGESGVGAAPPAVVYDSRGKLEER